MAKIKKLGPLFFFIIYLNQKYESFRFWTVEQLESEYLGFGKFIYFSPLLNAKVHYVTPLTVYVEVQNTDVYFVFMPILYTE
jgi:hypothetical protein